MGSSSYNATITNLVSNLHKLLIEKEELFYFAKPDNRAIERIDHTIEVQKKLLLQSLRGTKDKIILLEKSLEEKVKTLEDKIFNTPSKELEYSRLQRIFSINETFYSMLQQKKTEYSISRAGFVSNNIILKKAYEPTSPIFPNKKNIFILTNRVSQEKFTLTMEE